jgi:SAM-dependent methyltransferase
MHARLRAILVCPRCRGKLLWDEGCRCPRCKVVFPVHDDVPRMNDGAPERDAKMAAEWKAQSNARTLYVDRTSILNRWEEQVLPRLVEWLGKVSGPVLDVGCGVGHLGRVLTAAGRDDIELVGIDFQSELLAEATTGYVGLIEGDVHCLPIRDSEFAAVIASNSLHHFAEPDVAMREITRVLRPGGQFVGHDPRYVTPLERAKKLMRRHDAAFTEDHKAFRVDEYRTLLGAGGLTVAEVSTVDPAGPLVATALDYLKVGHLGVAESVAKLLAAVDRRLAGPKHRTPFGLMLAGRAVKEGNC